MSLNKRTKNTIKVFYFYSIYDTYLDELYQKECFMDNANDVLNSINQPVKAKTSNKKRKWREIEQLKEQYQLERDLKIYEDSLEYMLDDF